MKSKDKEERDKSDARNNLEELVYAIRDRLYAQYEGFVQENEKSNLSKQCDEIEDWLYGDGEDQPKSEFFCKLLKRQHISNPDRVSIKISAEIIHF